MELENIEKLIFKKKEHQDRLRSLREPPKLILKATKSSIIYPSITYDCVVPGEDMYGIMSAFNNWYVEHSEYYIRKNKEVDEEKKILRDKISQIETIVESQLKED